MLTDLDVFSGVGIHDSWLQMVDQEETDLWERMSQKEKNKIEISEDPLVLGGATIIRRKQLSSSWFLLVSSKDFLICANTRNT